ncbi:hypothetical protein ACP70R_019858 [Stipagrostis hirtigluma subsp. patula]
MPHCKRGNRYGHGKPQMAPVVINILAPNENPCYGGGAMTSGKKKTKKHSKKQVAYGEAEYASRRHGGAVKRQAFQQQEVFEEEDEMYSRHHGATPMMKLGYNQEAYGDAAAGYTRHEYAAGRGVLASYDGQQEAAYGGAAVGGAAVHKSAYRQRQVGYAGGAYPQQVYGATATTYNVVNAGVYRSDNHEVYESEESEEESEEESDSEESEEESDSDEETFPQRGCHPYGGARPYY